jgi:hypothetical protein
LPIEVPATSTNWPGDEMVGGDLAPDSIRLSGRRGTRELALRLDLRLGEVAALGLGHA